ncbi:flavin-containing monooxygenase [Nocardioides mangrovi]|uniref:NAD(P)/FAD-dependent oxidoreductase n=1 Tax=Nocardioides mangrovi TaxID=2874580 RepID=A0ABS7U9F0_9ACTN|nr:NAD(P)/FAD-dependent oxidoreductase [Nocardioides mangrovi]MBZ5737605.1 NAD(P)/FAD-dependent oxidoreductase [Nocardioides mangrovi]
MAAQSPQPEVARVDHLIVGAGFAGLCAAIKLQEDGERDFLVVEKGSDVGGTWRDNTYPGAACDVPSQLYSYSFAPNPEWSSSYSPPPEIQAYIRGVAERSGTLDRFVFDTTFDGGDWDDVEARWRVQVTGPAGTRTVLARTLTLGAGALSEPRLPAIEGIETFQGHLFHSSRWDHSVDLTGKRVAVVGTGASAIQIVPEMQRVAGHLDVYQRTAPWIIPRNDRVYGGLERRLLRRVPALGRLYRTGIYWAHEGYVPAFTIEPKMAAPARAAALANIRKGISDPALRAQVTPHFEIGCKRILRSNTYYPALAADNTELVTDRIAKVTGDAVVTVDGVERPVDVLVVATGFWTTELPIAEHVRDAAGRTLADVWQRDGMAAYKGTTVPGFPNLFMLTGPNTGQGHTSMVFIIEAQVAYLRDAIRTMRERGWAAVEPRQGAFQRWNANLQRRMKRTVWTRGGCDSWYLDEHGRNTTLWPKSTVTFRRDLARFDADAYDVRRTDPTPTREDLPA